MENEPRSSDTASASSAAVGWAQVWFETNRGQSASDVLFVGHSKAGRQALLPVVIASGAAQSPPLLTIAVK